MLFKVWAEGSLVADIVLFILLIILFLLFITAFLKLGLGFVDAEKDTFGQAFLTALLCTICLGVLFYLIWWIIALIIGVFICWIIIALRHKTGFGGAILVTIVAIVCAVIIVIIIIFVLALLIGVTLILWPF